MGLTGVPIACLQFQRNNKVFVPFFIVASNLHRGIYIALESIHGGPDMLLDFKQFADAQVVFRTVTILDQGLGLFTNQPKAAFIKSQHLPLV